MVNVISARNKNTMCCIYSNGLYNVGDSIKTVYNYLPKIQERVRALGEYKDKILTTKNML